MKKTFTTVHLVAFLLLHGISLKAQSSINHISYNSDGSISMVTFKKGTSKNNLSTTSKSTPNSLNKILNLSENIDFQLAKTTNGTQKFVTEYYKTYLNGYPIEGGEYRINYNNNDLLSISGRTFSSNAEEIKNLISEVEAFNLAKKSINAKTYAWENFMKVKNISYEKPKGELVYIPIEQQGGKVSLILAYKFDIFATQPLSRNYVYIDATTGLVLKKAAIIKHTERSHRKINIDNSPINKNRSILIEDDLGNADTRYSGKKTIETELYEGSYILYDTSRDVEIATMNANRTTKINEYTEFEDLDNNWTAEEFHNENKDDAALDAHWGVTKTYDYFKDTFNRNSYDNNGAPLYSFVHYDSKYENAFWSGNFMVYGDGNTTFDALTAFDITAHELGHAVCQETANLDYERESGALNEGFSDIWAAIVEHKYAPEKKPFLIGEDVYLQEPLYLRSMSDPKSKNQPDTYKGKLWFTSSVEDGCVVPSQTGNDYCGVHYNSSILNHWFYILVNGKSGTNDIGNTYDVNGIGWEKAEQIVYRLETAYLTSKSDYKNARDFAIQSAIDLYAENSLEAIAVQDAFYAVGVGGKYLISPDTKAPNAPTNLVAKDATGDAVNLSWNPSTDENGIWGYSILQDGVEVYKTPETSFRLTGLTKNTSYDFKVQAYDIYSNLSPESNVANIVTTSQPNACLSTSFNPVFFTIGNVKIGEINNSSTKAIGYEDFAYLNTTLELDTDYTIEITPNIATGYDINLLGYSIFLDKDNSGSNFTTNRRVATISPVAGVETVKTTFKLPTDTVLDTPLRLRIIQSFNSSQTSGCVGFTYGQVEDYSITAKEKTLSVDDLLKDETIKIYPNPVKESLNVISKDKNDFTYEISSLTGSFIKSGSSKGNINVNYIQPGVYILKVIQNGKVTIQKFIKQ